MARCCCRTNRRGRCCASAMPVERVKRRLRTAVGAVLAAATLAAAAQGAGAGSAAPSEERLMLCAACHGPQGRSVQPAWPSLAGQPRLFVETQLVLIREGLREVPEMAAVMQGMSDAEIGALASYFA